MASITKLTTELVRQGLVDDQEWPRLSTNANVTKIDPANPVNRDVLRAGSYVELYEGQATKRAFNFVFLDKALAQMSYQFEGADLVRHRLAFLPSPSLIEFQNDPEFYLREHPYSDVVGRQGVSVPMRFDFDRAAAGDGHPASHLTIGQYQHCRIPVSAPVTPAVFVDFLVRHFYEAPGMKPTQIDRELDRRFEISSTDLEEAMHMMSPGRR